MSTIGDRALTPEALAQHLGDLPAAALVHRASGGWLPLARAAVEMIGRTGREPEELLASAGFADLVVSGIADFDIPLGQADLLGTEVLSLLDAFTEELARIVFEAAADVLGPSTTFADPGAAILRLQSVGAVVADSAEGSWIVPPLLAAWLRLRRARSEPDSGPTSSGPLQGVVAAALVEQVEFTGTPDPCLVDNALLLSRHSRDWTLLARIVMAQGFPLLYRHPRATTEAFHRLPGTALRAIPLLGTFAAAAEAVREHLGESDLLERGADLSEVDRTRLRTFVARCTGPGSVIGRGSLTVTTEESVDDGPPPSTPERPRQPWEVLSRMRHLGALGRHREALGVGTRFDPGPRPQRGRCLIKWQAAIHAVHAGDPGRALTLLHGVEDAARETSVPGDFVAPAVVAWTALAAFATGDHKQADAELALFSELDTPPIVLESAFRPAALVTAAYRALDRLDLDTAAALVERMKSFPEMGDLWVHVALFERMLAHVTARSDSGLLRADESVEMYSQGRTPTEAGEPLLRASRVETLIGIGQLYRAELLIEGLPRDSGARHVLSARSELVAGQNTAAVELAEAHSFDKRLDGRQRAELTGIRAVAHLRSGEVDRARAVFREALELSVWVGSLLPVATLPAGDRQELLGLVEDDPVWDQVAAEFALPRLRRVLVEAGPAIMSRVDGPRLGKRERSLLEQLDQGRSVTEISHEFHLVEGTVKNYLSALYRKLGVNDRESAVARARALGFLVASDT
jgi:DNA-binding CsgD family transcriptional regulator